MFDQELKTINKSLLLNWLYKQKINVPISELDAYIKPNTKKPNSDSLKQKD